MGSELIPDLPADWKSLPLIECTTDSVISYGIVQPGQHSDSGIPIIRVNNFGNGKLDLSTVLKVTPEIESKFSRTRLVGGEVLLTLVGSTGQSIVAPAELAGWNVPRAVAVIRPTDEVGADWINICLQTEFTKHFLDSRANTTVQKTLNLADVKKIPIPIPPKSIREFIETNIASLDTKIQLNRQTNETLEKMAQALFKSWFVDFDPVIDNALAAGNPIPDELQERAERRQQQLAKLDHKPLPDDVRQLFPSEFELTEELGWVPNGWAIKRTEEISEKIAMGPFGSNIKVSTFVESGIPIISGHHLKGFLLDEHKHNFITNEHAENLKNSTVFPGDIIFTHAGNIGQVALIPKEVSFEKFVISQRQFYLRPRLSDVSAAYLLYYFKSNLGQHNLLANASQTGVPSIARPSSHLKSIELIVPSMTLIKVFDEQCHSFFEKFMAIRDNSKSLSKLRDTLLPKLISGELRLPSEALADVEPQPASAIV